MLRLVDAFSDAPFLEGGWDRALHAFAEATGSSRGQLIGIGGPAVIPFNIVTNLDDSVLRAFVEIDGGSPERSFRVAASRGPLEVVAEEDYAATRRAIRGDIYNDFCREHDIPHGIQTVLHRDNRLLLGLAVMRTEREGKSSADQRALFARAAPHVLRAVRIQHAMDGQSMQLLKGSLDELTVAAFVLDYAGTVRAMTGAAELEIASGGRLDLREGRLRTTVSREQSALDNAVAAALRMPGSSTSFALCGIPRPAASPAAVSVHPIGVGKEAFGFAPKALVIVRGAPREQEAHLLRMAYGLTSAEAAVAMQMAQGLDREQIALARNVSVATIYSQLRAIFDKMGVKREVDLVVSVLRLTRI